MGKKITVEQDGHKIWEGPERRAQMFERTFFGLFTVRDIVAGMIYIISVTSTITILWMTQNQRMALLEANYLILSTRVSINEKCAQNSDIYHSSVSGTPFECGSPKSYDFKTNKMKRLIDKQIYNNENET